jgi:hypothetical protein
MNPRFLRHLLLAVLSAAVSFSAQSQRFADYGQYPVSEQQLKECDFDPEATAIILKHEAHAGYDDDYRLVMSHHIRMKILKEEGLKCAQVKIPYYRKDGIETISHIKAQSVEFNPGNPMKVVQVAARDITYAPVNELYGEVAFSFPNAKVGSIIEYMYVSTNKYYGSLDGWRFQDSYPTVLSKLEVSVVPTADFVYRTYVDPKYSIKITADKTSHGMKFSMERIPGLEDEPYMDCRKDNLQHVEFDISQGGTVRQTSKANWTDLTKSLLSEGDFGGQLNKNIDGADALLAEANALPDDESKISLLLEYVKGNISWNNYTSLFSKQGVKGTWKSKSGNSGDINLLLINLLKSAKLEAYPMLVSERENGSVDVNHPFLGQFNKVIAFVVTPNRNYYLDATNKLCSYKITPPSLLNATGFLVDSRKQGFSFVKDPVNKYNRSIIFSGKVDETGQVTGQVTMYHDGYAKLIARERYFRLAENYAKDYIPRPELVVDSFSISNERSDSLALKEFVRFKLPMQSSGEYSFLPVNLYTGFEKNPFLSDKRFSKVNFGYPNLITVQIAIAIPESFAIDQLPAKVEKLNSNQTMLFARELQYSKLTKMLTGRIKIETAQTTFALDQYSGLKEFFKEMVDALNEPVVLKKAQSSTAGR